MNKEILSYVSAMCYDLTQIVGYTKKQLNLGLQSVEFKLALQVIIMSGIFQKRLKINAANHIYSNRA